MRIPLALLLGFVFAIFILGSCGDGVPSEARPPDAIDEASCADGTSLGGNDARVFGCDEEFYEDYRLATSSLRWCYDIELERVHEAMCGE